MKVFIDCRWYSQPGQGIVTYLSALHSHAEALVSGKGDVEFWYGVDSIADVDMSLLPPGARLIEAGRRSLLWRLAVFPLWLRRHGFDVAHFQYVAPLFSLGVRYVVTTHDILFMSHPNLFSFAHRLPRRLLYGWSVRTAARVLTVSERSADEITRLMGPQRPPVVIYNGAGLVKPNEGRPSSPVARLRDARFLLTVGRVEPRKNYGRLAQAFAESGLRQAGWHLVVVGFCEGEFSAELLALQQTKGVVWLSRVPESELNWLYSHAKGFVYPSLCEGFGIPVLEAIEAKLPYAVSNTFPLFDVVSEADEVFDPYDKASMAQAMQRLVLLESSQCSRDHLLQRYDWRRSAERYLDTLRELAVQHARCAEPVP